MQGSEVPERKFVTPFRREEAGAVLAMDCVAFLFQLRARGADSRGRPERPGSEARQKVPLDLVSQESFTFVSWEAETSRDVKRLFRGSRSRSQLPFQDGHRKPSLPDHPERLAHHQKDRTTPFTGPARLQGQDLLGKGSGCFLFLRGHAEGHRVQPTSLEVPEFVREFFQSFEEEPQPDCREGHQGKLTCPREEHPERRFTGPQSSQLLGGRDPEKRRQGQGQSQLEGPGQGPDPLPKARRRPVEPPPCLLFEGKEPPLQGPQSAVHLFRRK